MNIIKIINKVRYIFKSIKRYGWYIPVVNSLWYIKRIIPINIYEKLVHYKHLQVHRYLKRYFNEDMIPSNSVISISGELPIWFAWLQGKNNLPEICRCCYKLLCSNANGHPVIFVSNNNVDDYIDIPHYIKEKYAKGIIPPALYTDIIRICLLAKYGGLWVDATVLITQPISKDYFDKPFNSIKIHERDNYVTRCMWTVFLLSTNGKKNYFPVIRDMLFEYWLHEDCYIDYFLTDYCIDYIYQNDKDFNNLINDIPYTNEAMLDMVLKMNEVFDKEEWIALMQNTCFFKLTYRAQFNKTNGSSKTFYGHLIDDILGV